MTKSVPASNGFQLTFDPRIDESHRALGSVYRTVHVGAEAHEYFYDANGRRRAKQYPINAWTDEYFWSGTQLLEDRGVPDESAAAGPVTHYPIDEYVWLEGMPVAVILGRLDSNKVRLPDATVPSSGLGDCSRNKELRDCGTYFIVNDHLPKPVLLLDAAARVVGAADYDPFGHVNRTAYFSDTNHPVQAAEKKVLAYIRQPGSDKIRTDVRARFANTHVDYGKAYYSNIWASSKGDILNVTNPSAPAQGPVIGPWVQLQATENWALQVRFDSASGTQGAAAGIYMDAYETRRYQKEGVSNPFWIPLRLPGQYHDSESDLFENWNRFYDPSIGRYLSPDPILLYPEEVVAAAAVGTTYPAYSYASNNPIMFTDPEGLKVVNNSSEVIYVKPEGSAEPVAVQPGETFPDAQDGVAVPGSRPDEVLKTTNDIDVTVNQDGTVDIAVAPTPESLSPNARDAQAAQNALTVVVQEVRGGWKDQSWVSGKENRSTVERALRINSPKPDWQPLMDRARGGQR